MRKSTLRAIAAICIAALLFSVTACQGGKKENTNQISEGVKPKEKVVFDMFRNVGAPEYPPDGGEAKAIILDALKKYGLDNVDFNVTLASGNEYTTKLNTLAASGSLPDLFTLDANTLLRFSEQGLLLNVKDYLSKSPNLMKVLRKDDLDTLSTPEGSLYAIPMGYRPEPFNGSANAYVVRQDWLDKLKIANPTTLNEFYNMLKAFTFNDPDGNGKNDTYGLGCTKDSTFPSIIGAFGIAPGLWFERNSILKNGIVLPEMKEALKVLQQWYTEGLIDPDFPVTDTKAAEQKFVGSKVGAYQASAMSVSPENPDYAALKKLNPNAKVSMLAPPKGPNGLSGWPEGATPYSRPTGISAKTKNADLLFKFLDWSVNDTPEGGFYLLTYGIEGKHYTYDRQKNVIVLSDISYSELYKLGFSNPVRFIQLTDRRWMNDEAKAAMTVASSNVIVSKFRKQLPVISEYPELNTLFNSYFTKIVTGALSVDAYDDFIKQYYQKGGKQIEDAVNAEYAKYKK